MTTTAPPVTAVPRIPPGGSRASASRRVIQCKLAVGQSDDPAEAEAEGFAEETMSGRPPVQHPRRPARLRARPGVPESWSAPPDVEQVIATSGSPMEPDLRDEMEVRSGHDFSQVRIHAGAKAAASARTIGALAYAAGSHVVFGDGQFSPATSAGRRLIAHELAHVVQQREGGAGAVRVARQGGPPVPPLLRFLTSQEIQKLRGFGDGDYQSSLSTLEGHLRKTKGFTTGGDSQKYVDIRQAAGELRTFRDYVNDPAVTAVKVVPSATGGRSPDMYLRYGNNEVRRVEISNVTLASPDYRPDVRTDAQGRTVPRISREDVPDQPGKTRVTLPTNEFDENAIKGAIRSKIKASSKGPSQLDAQNPNTRAGGAPMAPGGDVVVQITHGEVNKARLDRMIEELQPELTASSARRVVVNAVDADEPRGGRKIFEYNREGDRFVGITRRPNRPAVPAPGENPLAAGASRAGAPAGVLRGLGSVIWAVIVQYALSYLLQRIAAHLERKQVEAGLQKLQPGMQAKLDGLTGQILERQSASDQPVYAVIKYSLNYMHTLEDRSQRGLFLGETPGDVESNKVLQDARKAEQDVTFFVDASLIDVSLATGEQPKDAASVATTPHPSGTFETQVFTFQTSSQLQRFSKTDLRDYVLEQALAEEMNGTGGDQPEGRSAELRKRLDALQGSIEKEEQTKRADAEREQKADEKRKQDKLAESRRAQSAPASAGPPLLPQPGVAAPKVEANPQKDPFNLGGRPENRSPAEQAGDAADIAEALKSEFVTKAATLKREGASGARLTAHQAEVEKWIVALGQVHAAWKAKGSSEWPGVKRLAYLVWWVNEPEGRTALFR